MLWKLFRCLGLSVIIVLLILPVTVLAGTSSDVTVTATGIVAAPPGPADFIVFYINDYTVGISWTKPPGIINTMIRAKYGSPPTAVTDGYQVYYGAGNTTNDTAVSLDETATQVYYRAWSENATGRWSTTFGQGQMEGIGVTLLALIAGAVGLSFIGVKSSYYILKVLAGIFWWGIGFFWRANPPSTIAAGTPPHEVIMVMFFIVGVSFMFFAFWSTKVENGAETNGKFRLPFMRTDKQEDEERIRRYKPSMRERNAKYEEKVDSAWRGENRRR